MNDWAERLAAQHAACSKMTEGSLRMKDLGARVEVLRDRWGVPHVYADNLHDLFFTQGFLTASERLFQIDRLIRTSQGRLATLFGEAGVASDRWTRHMGLHLTPTRIGPLEDLSAEMLGAWGDGVRAWLDRLPALPLEYELLGAEPEFPSGPDAERVLTAVWTWFCFNPNYWSVELLREAVAARVGWEAMTVLLPGSAAAPTPACAGKLGGRRTEPADVLAALPEPRQQMGSNNWAVSGGRSVTGAPLLANDSHQSFETPSGWFEVHLTAPGYEASGVALLFSPGVVIGHTATTAWSFTDTTGDPADLYLERLNEDGTAALYCDTWEPLVLREEEIEVRGRSTPERLTARESRHGPLLDVLPPNLAGLEPEHAYAVRWAPSDRWFEVATLARMAAAPDFPSFREALRGWNLLGNNSLFADAAGNIGYQMAATYPIRRAGDGSVPVPGWTDEYEWLGTIPFDELPWACNPESGFLVTANQKTHDESYPYLIGRDFQAPTRAKRIARLLTATERHSRDTFRAIQQDVVSVRAQELLPFLRALSPADERQRAALDLLADWDGAMAADSTAACIYQAWIGQLLRALLLDRLGEPLFDAYCMQRWTAALPELLEYPTATWFGADGDEARDTVLLVALGDALDELALALGDDMDDWRWGRLHRLRFVHNITTVLPCDEDLRSLLTAGVFEAGGDHDTVNKAKFRLAGDYEPVVVPTWRQVIDLADIDASLGSHTTGQSGNPLSPHWNDLCGPWLSGELHPLPFSRPAVEAVTESTLVLEP